MTDAARPVVWHKVPATRWPSRAEAERARWFTPIRLGPLTARTRTWVPAMVPWRATDDGEVTANVLDWYARFARGRPGVLVVEATGIRDVPSGPLLRIGHERFLPGLQELVETVREASDGQTRLLIQIIDFLAIKRRPPREKYLQRFLALTDRHRDALAARDPSLRDADDPALRDALMTLPDDELGAILNARELRDLTMGYRETVNDLQLAHIRELPQVLPGLFAAAAARARTVGFDGVELHYAHAYTMASLLSALNERADGYGASREGRVRLPLEVLAATRAAVGDDYCVGARILGDEVVEGGSRLSDAEFYAVQLARAGLDYVSVSKGGKFEDAKQPRIGEAAYPYTGRSGHECMPTVRSDDAGPFSRNVPLAAGIRRALRAADLATPVVTAGGICAFDQAEAILARGDADVVAAARQTLADPDWFRKIELGRGPEVRRCKFTNYCEGLDQRHKEVTCQLWDRDFAGSEAATKSKDGKRRLVAPDWHE
ncbi:MAG: NADH:flavin oxidoreductase [Planctomycetota bacterium]